MAEPLKPSESKENPSTKKTKQHTTPDVAAALLTSALWYCLDAGLIVKSYSEGNTLILEIDGLSYADEKIIVTPGVPEVTPIVTPIGVTSETK